MKYLILTPIIAIAIFSCNISVNNKVELSSEDSISSIANTDSMLITGDSLDYYLYKIKKSVENIKSDLTTKNKTEANKLYNQFNKESNDLIVKISTLIPSTIENYGGMVGENLEEKDKEIIKKIAQADLEIRYEGEGMAGLYFKPFFLIHLFNDYITDDYKDYYTQMAIEDTSLYSSDGGILISWDDLGERIIKWDNFISKYEKSELLENAKSMHKGYIYDYSIGMDNTPVFGFEGTISDEFLNSYKKIMAKYPDSKTADYLKNYIQLIEKNKGVFSDEIQNWVTKNIE